MYYRNHLLIFYLFKGKQNNIFFNYHKEAIEDTKNYLDKLSPEDKNYESIKEKYNWIKNYHNSHLSSTHKIQLEKAINKKRLNQKIEPLKLPMWQ